MKRVAKRKPDRESKPQVLSKFAIAQTRLRLKRVISKIERATKHPRNPETAHDLRVSIRRFTQCLRTFEELFEGGPAKKMRKKLRKLMDLCGAKRDFDVGIQVLADAGVAADHPAFARFQEQRDHGMRELARSLHKKHKWSAIGHWPAQLTPRRQRVGVPPPNAEWDWNAEVSENAKRILPRLAERFFHDGHATAAARNLELMHPFRLHAKRLRYTLEVFGRCYGDAFDEKIRDLRGLQDCLGAINDCSVVLKLPGMNRTASGAVRKLLAARDAAFRKYWSETFSGRRQESWMRVLSSAHAPRRGGVSSPVKRVARSS